MLPEVKYVYVLIFCSDCIELLPFCKLRFLVQSARQLFDYYLLLHTKLFRKNVLIINMYERMRQPFLNVCTCALKTKHSVLLWTDLRHASLLVTRGLTCF